MYDDYTYEKLSLRLVEYTNTVHIMFKMYVTKQHGKLDSPNYYIRVIYSDMFGEQTELFNFWQSAYSCIYKLLLRYKDYLKCHFIEDGMSIEEIDLQLAIRGY